MWWRRCASAAAWERPACSRWPETRGEGTHMARILLVEDDPALSRGIIALLKAAGHAADSAKDGETALFLAETEPCSLVIQDIGLPDMSGFEVLKRLRARGCKTPILVLTARDHVTDRVKGLDLGADDYLLKPFDASELGARVRALLRRDHGDPSPVLVIGNLTIDRARATAEVSGRPLQLRRREWAVLDRLTAKAGEVVSKERLIAEVFSYDDERAWIYAQGFVILRRVPKSRPNCIDFATSGNRVIGRNVQIIDNEIPDRVIGYSDDRSVRRSTDTCRPSVEQLRTGRPYCAPDQHRPHAVQCLGHRSRPDPEGQYRTDCAGRPAAGDGGDAQGSLPDRDHRDRGAAGHRHRESCPIRRRHSNCLAESGSSAIHGRSTGLPRARGTGSACHRRVARSGSRNDRHAEHGLGRSRQRREDG